MDRSINKIDTVLVTMSHYFHEKRQSFIKTWKEFLFVTNEIIYLNIFFKI